MERGQACLMAGEHGGTWGDGYREGNVFQVSGTE